MTCPKSTILAQNDCIVSQVFRTAALTCALLALAACQNKKEITPAVETATYDEAYRPQLHFSPEAHWMNDPNGLVYHQGVYHLFYQYYPEDIVWGPMHWGHATSTDLVSWTHQPIALFPDQHGYIFSGSAVVDTQNTSGLGTLENPPMVALFTYHKAEREKEGFNDFQTQGLAYSLDNGQTWTKYDQNPVIKNPNSIRDFRDPKVFWNDLTQAWTMLLVAGDHVQIWGSKNLIDWTQQSTFGHELGAHGGVWECPDLFALPVDGTDQVRWVMLVSINPGAPNGGSGTQYFVGDFDGTAFTTDQKDPLWIDGGTDNYAGVTYNHTPDGSRQFIGWMSNWAYGQQTPTKEWRSSMTLARTLSLRPTPQGPRLRTKPLPALASYSQGAAEAVTMDQPWTQPSQGHLQGQVTGDQVWTLSNASGQSVVFTFEATKNRITVDRSASGDVSFSEAFVAAPVQMDWDNPLDNTPVSFYLDASSIELFVGDGDQVMTLQVFPTTPWDRVSVVSASGSAPDYSLSWQPMRSIWEKS